MWVDENGLEIIVISGGITSSDYDSRGRYEQFEYQFIETALRDIKNEASFRDSIIIHTLGIVKTEEISWVVIDYGYSASDRQKFSEAAKIYDVNLILVDEKQELINYINTKNKNSQNCSNKRNDDPITAMRIYSHGLIGYLGFGFNSSSSVNYQRGRQLNFYKEDINKLNSSAFKNTDTVFYSCNTGTADSTGTSFAQEWVNLTGGTTRAVVGGKTNYENINVVPWWNVSGLSDKLAAKISRGEHGFSFLGSVNAPVASGNAKWKNFKPR